MDKADRADLAYPQIITQLQVIASSCIHQYWFPATLCASITLTVGLPPSFTPYHGIHLVLSSTSAFLDLTRCTSKLQNNQLQATVVQMLSEPTTIDPVPMWQAQVITTEDDASRTRQLVAALCQNKDPAKPSTAALCDKLLANDSNSTQAVGLLLLVQSQVHGMSPHTLAIQQHGIVHFNM